MPYVDTKEIFSGIKKLPFLKDINIEYDSKLEPIIKEKLGGSIIELVKIRINGEEIEFAAPYQFNDGHFYLDGMEVFTPLLVIEKDRLLTGKAPRKTVDLDNSYIVPMYWFAVSLSIERIVKRKDSSFTASAKLSSLLTFGYPNAVTKYNSITDKNENEKRINIILRKPFFFPLEEKNLFLRNSQLREIKYLDRMVQNEKRYNSKSFQGKIGFVETPESKDMGLVRFLTYGAKYVPEELEILPSNEKIFGNFTPSTLSVPFFNHSDSPRVMMGGKNMKQALIVDKMEKPTITTSFECQDIGVNAVVGYMSYKGLNFEDAVIVSESFAKKMHVTVLEKIDYIFDSNEKIDSIEKFKSIFKTRKIGEHLKPSQWLIKRENKTEKLYDIEYDGKLIDMTKPKMIVQSPKLRNKNRGKGRKSKSPYSYKITFNFMVSKPLKVGDKLMGRHGNKGIVSKILPISEMPFTFIDEEKIYLEVILNPMGVISRMNIGQLIETSEALAVKYDLKKKCEYKPFEEPDMNETLKALQSLGADEFGRFEVKDKKSSYGMINVGIQYMIRLYHNATEKLAARSFGPVSPISGIPLHGRKHKGGQRFGEMEVWAMLSHGAIKTLNSLFTIDGDKSEKLLKEALNVMGYDYAYDPVKRETRFKRLSSFPQEEILFSNLKNEVRKERANPAKMMVNGIMYYVPNSEMMEALNLKGFYSRNFSEEEFDRKLKKNVSKILTGKSGLLRSIVLGKRVNYSGRAVIVPAPDLTIDEVYLPLKIAYEFTKDLLPKALKLQFKRFLEEKDDGKRLSVEIQKILMFRKDFVLLNRQPTLHRHNILSFKPKVWPEDVIGLPLLVCKGYNADFDGDQMAVYYPQGQENFKEELEKMKPSKNLFDTGSGELILHLTQDILLGAYLSSDKKIGKGEIKDFVSEKTDDPNFLKWLLDKQKKWLEKATYSGITLSYFEIKKNSGSYIVLKESKSRGSEQQFKQLNEEIEIDRKILGENKNKIIHSNFVKGLNVDEYTALTYRGINSMCDKKVNVSAPGYLTRKLVETMYPLKIEDCECEPVGLKIGIDGSNADIILNKEKNFVKALEGRYDTSGKLLDEKKLRKFWKKGYVDILSPITSSKICQKCYGLDQATQMLPKIGDYVGVTSATAIGERGTQKAMETFHTGKREVNFSEIEEFLLGNKAKSVKELLQKIVDNVYNFESIGKSDIGLSSLKLVNFELLALGIFLLSGNDKNIKWKKSDLLDPFKRGFLSALSFESPLRVIEKVIRALGKDEEIILEEKSGKFLGREF